MSQRLLRQSSALRYLAQAPPEISKAGLRGGDNKLITCLCECAKNILNGNVPLTPEEKEKLRPYKTHLRTLADKSVDHDRKRQILQRGGFIGALLAPLAGAILGPLLGGK